ncbi:MAG: hypothetical protein IIW21_03765 [Clostridia bacterium]|nr:hypothetical protein [Clostridia bacterium]
MLKKIILGIIASALAFFIMIFVYYFAVGSLEMWATPEKITQFREFCGAMIFVLSIIEFGVIVGLFKAFRK